MANLDIRISFDEALNIIREHVNQRYHLNDGPVAQHFIDVSRDIEDKLYRVSVTEIER